MQAIRGKQLRTPYLSCFICDKQSEEPRLCPRCVKSFCHSCLITNHTSLRDQCPACNARLREEEFLEPQAVVNLVVQVAEKVKKQLRKGQERQQCPEHNLALGYFCIDCNYPICGDCGLLTSKHIGHRFVSYRQIYEKIKKKVFDEFPRFDRKIKQLDERKGRLRSKLDSLSQENKRFKKCFQEAYINYTEKVEIAGKVAEEMVGAKGVANTRRLGELEHLRDSIYQQMEKKTQISLIKQTAGLVQSISALACQEPPSSMVLDESDELIELIPEYETWMYRLESFSTKTGIVYSQGKIINGVQWRLKIYPRGNGLARQKFLSVFVEMTKALMGQNKYEYRIELINPVDSSQTVKRQYCSTFQVGQCWGYNQFEHLEQLGVKQFIENDSLLFQIGIRNRSYRSLASDQELYIAALKAKIAEKNRLEEMKPKKVRGRLQLRSTEKKLIRGRQYKSPEKLEKTEKVQVSQKILQSEEKQELSKPLVYEQIQEYLRRQNK